MAEMAKYALKNFINDATREYNLPFIGTTSLKSGSLLPENDSCVALAYTASAFTIKNTPRVLVQHVGDITTATRGTAFDVFTIAVVHNINLGESDSIKIELGFDRLKQLFKKPQYVDFIAEGVTFHNQFEYVDGSDIYNGILSVSSTLMFNFLQFTVKTPKINY
jgi:hypothetical protein